jgi:hypothetical protein
MTGKQNQTLEHPAGPQGNHRLEYQAAVGNKDRLALVGDRLEMTGDFWQKFQPLVLQLGALLKASDHFMWLRSRPDDQDDVPLSESGVVGFVGFPAPIKDAEQAATINRASISRIDFLLIISSLLLK